jgi:methionyl-tRNA formyltransferase
MQMSLGMDEGAVWYRENAKLDFEKENLNIDILEYGIGYFGGSIFTKVINKIIGGEIESVPQDNDKTTYTRKYKKEDGDVTSLIGQINSLQTKINNINLELNKLNVNSDNQELKILNLELDNLLNMLFRKYIAFTPWPGIYFTHTYLPQNKNIDVKLKKEIRVKISEMEIIVDANSGAKSIKISSLTPQSKKQISLRDFENSFGKIF